MFVLSSPPLRVFCCFFHITCIGVIHFARFRGWEHPRAAGMLLMFCEEHSEVENCRCGFVYSSYQFAAKCQEYIHLLAAHPRFLLPQPPLPASLSLLPAFCRHSWISRFPVFSSYPAVYRPSQHPSFRFGSTDNYHTSGKSLLIFWEIGIFFSRFCICRKSLFFVYSGAAFALFGYRFSGANL